MSSKRIMEAASITGLRSAGFQPAGPQASLPAGWKPAERPPGEGGAPLPGTVRAPSRTEATGRRVAGRGAGIRKKEVVVSNRFSKPIFFLVVLLLTIAAIPAFAGPVPSKTAENQSLASREADLTIVRDVAANEQVAAVLAANGFSADEVNQRLAQMSPQDVHQLAQNLEQLQPAGLTKQEWIWIGIGAIAALILVIALS
jgi:hypothetical protein